LRTCEPVEMSELIWVGDGTGVGDGLGDGAGDWARAVEAIAASDIASAKQQAMGLASLRRPAPVPPIRDGPNKPRINAISEGAKPAMRKIVVQSCRFAPSSGRGSIVVGLPPKVIAVQCAPTATGDFSRFGRRGDFSSRARGLLMGQFRVAIAAAIGIWPLDCAFREDSEILQTTGSPFVAWHA
jgi:hypothetical protein